MTQPGAAGGLLAGLAPEDRPREKLVARGAEALTDEELVAILLGTGRAGAGVLETAREVLRGGGLRGLLARSERGRVRELARGIGVAKACRIAAAAELARRLARAEVAERPLLDAPEAAGAYLAATLAAELREVMGGLLLDAKNRLIHDAVVFRGGVTSASVQPGPLLRIAVLEGAAALVLYHNHPSGDPTPSPEDRATTARFVAAGEAVGVPVRDHVVVGRGLCFSFRREGLM
ncbi:MAG TPA: DNA repair protein RadC [Thermoanaerobaculia bacterium]|nr:DNA repair protein RadC [Thermoanaerobaculia bacterium]